MAVTISLQHALTMEKAKCAGESRVKPVINTGIKVHSGVKEIAIKFN